MDIKVQERSIQERSLRDTLLRITIIPGVAVTAILAALLILGAVLIGNEVIDHQSTLIITLSQGSDQYLSQTAHLITAAANILPSLQTDDRKILLEEIRQEHPSFITFYLLDEQGFVTLVDTDNPQNSDAKVGLDFSGAPFYTQVHESKKLYYSEPYRSIATNQVLITVAAPIMVDERLMEIVVGELDLKPLQEAIEQFDFEDSSVTFILDQKGNLIAHPQTTFVQERKNLGYFKIVRDAQEKPGEQVFGLFRDKEMTGNTLLLGSAAANQHGWTIVTTQPLAQAARSLIILALASAAALLLSLLLFIWSQVYSLKQITQPVAALVKKVDSLANGEKDVASLETANHFSEIASLSRSFNRMAEAVQERDRLLEQRVADRTQRLKTLAALGEYLNTILDAQVLLVEIVEQIRQSFDYYFVAIFLLDQSTNCLVIQESSGEAGPALKASKLYISLDASPSLVAQAARSAEIINIDDVLTAGDWLSHPLLQDARSEIVIPIVIEERVVGVLDVQENYPQAFDASQVDMFTSLATQIGIAMHNASLYTQMESQVAERTLELSVANQALKEELAERRRIEIARQHLIEQVQEQARQVRQIMDTVPEGVLLIDASYCVLMSNPAGKTHLHLLADAAPGDYLTHLGDHPMPALLAPPPKGLWHEIGASKQIYEMAARPLQSYGQTEGWVIVLRDVTREREMQHMVQQQERLAAVGQLAAGIAHDFNNIMAVIQLYTEIAIGAPDTPSWLRERLKIILEQNQRATHLVQQILDFSRRAVLERCPMDLLSFVKEQIKLLERTLPENLHIHFSYETGNYTINADPTRIQQAMMNLAVNARDAMPDGGELNVKLHPIHPAEVIQCITCGRVIPDPQQAWICLSFSDTGNGIPEEILPHIFEPFFTTKQPGQGTGLGLSQVYGIVKLHEGHIQVNTSVGKNCTFTLYLPAIMQLPEPSPGPSESITEGQGQMILLVEDEIITRAAILDSLVLLNYKVHAASNGKEAIDFLDHNKGFVDLILSDVVMPQMGGIPLFHTLRERGLTTPIILMSGHPMQEQLKELQNSGLTGWLLKPPNLKQLAQAVAQALG